VIRAYGQGAFPMAEGRRGEVHWYSPDPRAVLPLDGAKFSQSLMRRVRSGRFEVTIDSRFGDVMRACARPRPGHDETWINDENIRVYTTLHEMGIAHSVEAWTRGHPRTLVGGLYGLALGGAFFGESMFSTATDASKVCLVHLVEHLRARGYALLDTQINNPHMDQFGTTEIPRDEYLRRLDAALDMEVKW
jgi:leucyl/phenylalanyl-tRNA--protein transferase